MALPSGPEGPGFRAKTDMISETTLSDPAATIPQHTHTEDPS